MLPLDHLQGNAQIAEKGHERIVKQSVSPERLRLRY
jgi:hypothetical protein